MRGELSGTVGAPGVGKTHITVAETLSKITGRQLLHDAPRGQLRCWAWFGEESETELERRFAAARRHYDITDAEIGDRLFVRAGRRREQKLVIAKRTPKGVEVLAPVVDNLVREIRDNGIDSFTVDPFVKSHDAEENDNNAIDQVAQAWADVAMAGNCAVSLFHHPRKTLDGTVSVNDLRGGSALLAAVRFARTFNKMTADEARDARIKQKRWAYIRVDDGKANNAPPSVARWLHLESLLLRNGDNVAVATPWQWPDAMEGVSVSHLYEIQRRVEAEGGCRQNHQAKDWIGFIVAEVVGDMNPRKDAADKRRVMTLLERWETNGMFRREQRDNEKGKPNPYLIVGNWALPPPND
jgi:hypothetical protein